MSPKVTNRAIPELTALERIGPKGYLLARVLQAGYQGLIQRIPEVACEAIPDTNSKQKGVLKFQLQENDDAQIIVVKDLRDSPGPGYEELKSKFFPVASFNADTFCRRSVWPSAGDRLPISAVQANFICGGVILTWCILHMAGDGKLENHPEYTLLPFTPLGAPPKMASPNHRGQIFYFSPESLVALKADTSVTNATKPSDHKWISTNDALSALLWRTVVVVQSPLEALKGDPMSVFNIAIDAR
ncbi:hypothetical protein N7489_003619 [Penicillium chrysogenum]|uniref:uncharacterized protein n=1 Tax=Penicillium chrysogenum TaxID=5076 RepID=UPI0024DF2D4C|nr:uncharacterized protein N7489_003619 [Penicillium chrysogenum]KAJ5253209.1 hypothetical protein N7489_003619 [Penicillium chrysogenum]